VVSKIHKRRRMNIPTTMKRKEFTTDRLKKKKKMD
jgi:hypothetical protein